MWCSRYDYEGVESDAAGRVMDTVRKVSPPLASPAEDAAQSWAAAWHQAHDSSLVQAAPLTSRHDGWACPQLTGVARAQCVQHGTGAALLLLHPSYLPRV